MKDKNSEGCKYAGVCPAYDERREQYNSNLLTFGDLGCIPMILEAYHEIKGTPYENISKYIGFNGYQVR